MKKIFIFLSLIIASCIICFCGCQSSCQGCNGDNSDKYEIKFMLDGESYSTAYAKFGEFITEPQMPEKAGHVFKGWYISEAYIEKWSFKLDTVKDNVILYGYWIAESENSFNILYYDGTLLINSETVPSGFKANEYFPKEKDGQTFKGWYCGENLYDFDTRVYEDIVLRAEWEFVNYSVKFIADGVTVKECSYNLENKDITVPDIPSKEHYTAKWEKFELKTGDVEINAVYTPIIYSAKFVVDDKLYKEIEYSIEDCVKIPDIPKKSGFSVSWTNLPIKGGDVTITAEYIPIVYTISFAVSGKIIDTVEYTVLNKDFTTPAIPAREGYAGAWESVEFETGDITINAEYTLIKYKAVFIVDDTPYKTVYFTIEDMTVAEPFIPTKDGFIAKWQDYTLELKDIEIKAIYTPING